MKKCSVRFGYKHWCADNAKTAKSILNLRGGGGWRDKKCMNIFHTYDAEFNNSNDFPMERLTVYNTLHKNSAVPAIFFYLPNAKKIPKYPHEIAEKCKISATLKEMAATGRSGMNGILKSSFTCD